jgi:3-methyladenine DNA glycosylase AlkD
MEVVADKYKLLLKKFRTRENGPAVDSMNRMGLKYKRNFGIALSEIKSFSKEYSGDQEFALLLWNKTSREAKILSLMISDPNKLTKKQIENYILGIDNVELAEQAALNLLWKVPENIKHSLSWCKSKDTYTRLTGLLVVSKIAMSEKTVSDIEFLIFFDAFEDIAHEKSFHLKRGLSRALLQIAKRNEGLKTKTLKFIETVNSYNKEMALWLNEEVAYYLKNE